MPGRKTVWGIRTVSKKMRYNQKRKNRMEIEKILKYMCYSCFVKVSLRLLEIRITHSRHVESVIMMQNCGFKKK